MERWRRKSDQAVERILRIIFEYADHRKPEEFTWKRIMNRLSILQKNLWSF